MSSPQLQLMLQRAIQAFQSNSMSEAELILKNILKIDKYNPAALQIIGLIMVAQKKYRDAIKYLERAVQILPNDASVHYNLAKALMDDGQDKTALIHHKKTCELDPAKFSSIS
jgi:predicted Zn-dependent protease